MTLRVTWAEFDTDAGGGGPVTHTTSGSLTAGSGAISGTATHFALHTSSGALTGAGAVLTGTAVHPHTTTGVLSGGNAIIAGSAEHTSPGTFTTTGALVAGTGTVSGTAVHLTLHSVSGVLNGGNAIIVGSASKSSQSIGRPVSDDVAGAWLPSTGSDLYAMLDEVAYDDADYIYANSATTCEVGLNPVSDPLTSSGQVISYRAWSPTANGLTVKLKQGATVIATWTHATLPTTATMYQQSLSSGECDAITDYSSLKIELTST